MAGTGSTRVGLPGRDSDREDSEIDVEENSHDQSRAGRYRISHMGWGS